ncbi:MAG: hypothetical protein AB9888_15350 [Bacteroidales bacterium]
MEPSYTVFDNGEYALVNANFTTVEYLLKNDPKWGANILEMSGEYSWRVKLIQLQSWGWYSSHTISETTNRFITIAAIGQRSFLAYQIQETKNQLVRITPIGYVPIGIKIYTAFLLALFCIFPILLSPLIWKVYQFSILRSSKLYLDAFCRYLSLHLEL